MRKPMVAWVDLLAYLAFVPALFAWFILLPFPRLRQPIDRFFDMWHWF